MATFDFPVAFRWGEGERRTCRRGRGVVIPVMEAGTATVVAFTTGEVPFDGLPHVKVIADPKCLSAMEEGYGTTCYDERGEALSIAQRIASFLSLQDLLAYLNLEEKVKTCCKVLVA